MQPGDVFVKDTGKGRQIMRRIIAVMKGWVIYSTGGNDTHHCTVADFDKWAGHRDVQLTHRGRET